MSGKGDKGSKAREPNRDSAASGSKDDRERDRERARDQILAAEIAPPMPKAPKPKHPAYAWFLNMKANELECMKIKEALIYFCTQTSEGEHLMTYIRDNFPGADDASRVRGWFNSFYARAGSLMKDPDETDESIIEGFANAWKELMKYIELALDNFEAGAPLRADPAPKDQPAGFNFNLDVLPRFVMQEKTAAASGKYVDPLPYANLPKKRQLEREADDELGQKKELKDLKYQQVDTKRSEAIDLIVDQLKSKPLLNQCLGNIVGLLKAARKILDTDIPTIIHAANEAGACYDGGVIDNINTLETSLCAAVKQVAVYFANSPEDDFKTAHAIGSKFLNGSLVDRGAATWQAIGIDSEEMHIINNVLKQSAKKCERCGRAHATEKCYATTLAPNYRPNNPELPPFPRFDRHERERSPPLRRRSRSPVRHFGGYHSRHPPAPPGPRSNRDRDRR